MRIDNTPITRIDFDFLKETEERDFKELKNKLEKLEEFLGVEYKKTEGYVKKQN